MRSKQVVILWHAYNLKIAKNIGKHMVFFLAKPADPFGTTCSNITLIDLQQQRDTTYKNSSLVLWF